MRFSVHTGDAVFSQTGDKGGHLPVALRNLGDEPLARELRPRRLAMLLVVTMKTSFGFQFVRAAPPSGRPPYRLRNVCSSIFSTECGEIPSSANPSTPGEHTLSTCISSTWLRVTGGFGSSSAVHASARQAANGSGIKVRLRLALRTR